MDPKPNSSFSIYGAFSNSPISISDPWGDTDRVANYSYIPNNSSNASRNIYLSGEQEAFQREWDRAKANLKENGFEELVKYIEDCKEIVYIVQSLGVMNSGWMRSAEGLSLVYNPRGGLVTTSNHFLSPRTILVHELDHAVDDLINPWVHSLIRGFSGTPYGNFEV